MKICLINNLYPPYNRGGAERVVEHQVNNLLNQGHHVFLITTKPLFNSVEVIPPRNRFKIYRFYPLNIFSFYYLNKFSGLPRLIWRCFDIFNLHSYCKIKKILKQEKPDIIYSHNLTGIGYLIPRLIKKLKIKYIQTMHDVVLVYPSGLLIKDRENCFLNKFFLTRLWGKINKFLFNSPNEVRFPSAWLRGFYLERGFFKNSNCKIVRNFLITANAKTQPTRKHENTIHFIYIGQIEKHKGILFLIKTFYQLPVTSYQLLIVGNGSQLNNAKALAEPNPRIKFHPWQSKEKDRKFLKQADYLIVPSLCYENSPTVIFEALKVGTPVIASNLGGIPELIQDRINGYLFTAGDENSLKNILKKVII